MKKNKTSQCSFVSYCSHYEHCHVYLTYRRKTGNVMTCQTIDRAPTAHISRGEYIKFRSKWMSVQYVIN